MSDNPSSAKHPSLASADEPHLGDTSLRRLFVEPKLKFIEPQLIKRGDLTRVTAQCCFQEFSPSGLLQKF
jgi:hypothetical protein